MNLLEEIRSATASARLLLFIVYRGGNVADG